MVKRFNGGHERVDDSGGMHSIDVEFHEVVYREGFVVVNNLDSFGGG
jgi:hypothetical protein